jgi:hypothetical protein
MCPHGVCVALNVTSIERRGGGGAANAQTAQRGGDTKARQQKARRKMQHSIETFRCNTYNIRLKIDEILETYI